MDYNDIPFYMNNTFLFKQLFRKSFESGKAIYLHNYTKEPLLNDTNFIINPSSKASLPEPLTYFDSIVANAVYSLQQYSSSDTLHPGHILRMMSGDPNQTSSRVKNNAIRQSLQKMANAGLVIDCRAEMERRNSKIACQQLLKGRLLPIESPDNENPNANLSKDERKKRKAYHFSGTSPLFEYGELSTQIISVPYKMLSTGKVLQDGQEKKLITDTNENIMIKHYLLHRIEIMRHQDEENAQKESDTDKKTYTNRKISYGRRSHIPGEGKTGMFYELGFKDPHSSGSNDPIFVEKCKLASINVKRYLDYLKEIEYIQDYENTYDKLGKVDGIQINGPITKPSELSL